jgi:dTDP-4-dehydrorhamnose 3,5-epimerase
VLPTHRQAAWSIELIFEPLSVNGAFLIRPEPRHDERGHFARMWCRQELDKHGLTCDVAQVNTGFSPKAGTLRGLHLQTGEHAEVKIARCLRGAVFDVVVDLRPDSPSYRQWSSAELTADNGLMLYAPAGTAHGYLTLAADTELMYMTSRPYAPAAATGVRFDDPALAIRWPREITLVSAADRAWPDLR